MIPVDDYGKFVAEFGQILDRLADAIVGNVVGGGFGSQIRLVSDILLDKSILVVTADNRIGQIQVFNDGLEFSRMISADLTTENDGELVGLADRAVGIHQSLTKSVHGSPAREDQIVAKLDLREEQPVFHAGLLPFSGSEEWNQLREPFEPAAGEIPCCQ